ncbi:MAG: hypothetical protein WA208_11440 [Thermoanaerobaculia bacterium]
MTRALEVRIRDHAEAAACAAWAEVAPMLGKGMRAAMEQATRDAEGRAIAEFLGSLEVTLPPAEWIEWEKVARQYHGEFVLFIVGHGLRRILGGGSCGRNH